MNFFLEDPVLFWLVWGIFTLAGTIIGWSLRANTSEKEVRGTLNRIEQEKNTLARLYTQIKHQHDLREADFRRATLEVEKLRAIIQLLEDERAVLLPDAPFNAARIANAEAATAQYAQKVAALEVLANSLRDRLFDLTGEFNGRLTPTSIFGNPNMSAIAHPGAGSFLRSLMISNGLDGTLTGITVSGKSASGRGFWQIGPR